MTVQLLSDAEIAAIQERAMTQRPSSFDVLTLLSHIRAMTAENFALAAGQCIVDGGLIGHENGSQICTLASRLAAAEGANQWQPIETAPRDGTRIDLLAVYEGGKSKRAPDCYWHKKAGQWMCKHHDKEGYSLIRMPFSPTHWMYIPLSPLVRSTHP